MSPITTTYTTSGGWLPPPQERNGNIYMREEARRKLKAGVDAVADAVKLTLGAAGSNAVLESPLMPGHIVTNDGVSIARLIQLDDPVENIGANLIKEVANRSDKESGDGTTTTTVLTQAILEHGFEAEGSPMDIKRSLDECLPFIEASIDAQKKVITEDEVAQVATISGESEELGKLFQEVYQKIGKTGIIELDNSNLPSTYYEVGEGVRFRGTVLFGPHPQTESGKAIYKKPRVLVTKQRVASLEDVTPIVKELQKSGATEMVLFFDDIDMNVATQLSYAVMNGGFKVYLIKAPTLWKDWVIEDLALVTGATVADPSKGISLKDIRAQHLGTCDRLVCVKDEIRAVGIKDIEAHVRELEGGSDDDKLRASWLNTKAATLFIGANSDSELSYKRLKAEDARNASYLALQDGVVAGGGVALLNASSRLPRTVGGNILRDALQAPLLQIVANAGSEQDVSELGDALGFNAKTGAVEDMWKAGIVDPAKVVKNAIRNAISVAGTVLTASVVITIPKPDTNDSAANVSQLR